MSLNRNLPPVSTNRFAMVPRNDVPRSKFRSQHSLKSTFDAGYLVPIHVDEVLPGDVHEGHVTIFARLATLLFPVMDNVDVSTFFFFVPSRLLWTHWENFCGEQANPGDTIAYTIPQVVSAAGGFVVGSLYDYFGLPTVGQVLGGNTVSVNVLPVRAYQFIYQEWFRDENLQNSVTSFPVGDGPDSVGAYVLLRRNKKHDYFTSCLPWPLKGGVEVPMPIGLTAPVIPSGSAVAPQFKKGAGPTPTLTIQAASAASPVNTLQGSVSAAWAAGDNLNWGTTNLVADLASATGATINAMRLAVTTQQFLERDARGGTRYTESLRSHFGVTPEDARLQRPEYIGGGCSPVVVHSVPQTAAAGASPVGALAAASVVNGGHHFSYHATEHGYIIGLAHVGADLTYQQGVRKLWSRSTRYDFYWPAFAHLGEQAVLNREIYADGSANDAVVFGYQERWAEYRHFPSQITGLFKSRSAGTIDPWHLAQNFATLPTLNTTFIQDTPPLSRALAAGASANGAQILFDSFWSLDRTRPMPQYSVPGLQRF
ncbi:MAG: major capsid protein [Microviridae sp.]|nr:MAG: major capsid protein [Microviridae sp.]